MKREISGLVIRTVFNNQGWAGPCKNPFKDIRCFKCIQSSGLYINKGKPIVEDERGFCKGDVHNDPLLGDLWCWEQTLCTRFFWGNVLGKWRFVQEDMPVYFVYSDLDGSLTLWGKSIIDRIDNTPDRYPIYFKEFTPLPQDRWVKGLTGEELTGKYWKQLHFRYLDNQHESYLSSLIEGNKKVEKITNAIHSLDDYEITNIKLKRDVKEKLKKIAAEEGREVEEVIREAIAKLIRERVL